jgi:hypothetical protein
MCQVSFSEPALFKRRRDTNVAGTGLSRERPGSAVIAGAAAAGASDGLGEAPGAFYSSSCSAFSIRAVSLPPGTQRLSRGSALLAIASE